MKNGGKDDANGNVYAESVKRRNDFLWDKNSGCPQQGTA